MSHVPWIRCGSSMTTPLALVRRLRDSFPKFVEVRIVREGPGSLRAYCAIADESQRVPADMIAKWSHENVPLGTWLEVEQVSQMPTELDDEEALLRRTKIRRALVEEALTNVAGLRKNLCSHFLGEVLFVDTGAGRVTVHVDPAIPESRDQEIVDTTRLLLGADPVSLQISRQISADRDAMKPNAESANTYRLLAEDVALVNDHARDILGENPVALSPLPEGSSTYASVHDGVASLLSRLAMFERVYVYVPFSVEDFSTWAGTSFAEFLDVLPTGRVIPVFGQSIDRYEAGLTSRLLDAGAPRVVHRGEHALRALRALRDDYPELSIVNEEQGDALRRTVENEQEENAALYRGYLEALAEMSARLPSIALSGQTIAMAMQPLATWVDDARKQFGLPSRDLEMMTALEHRAVTLALGSGVPLSLEGHYLDPWLRWIYGAFPGKGRMLRVPEPTMIGRIAFPDTQGLSLREFARDFTGPAVKAMNELMSSERVQTADGSSDLVAAFNKELKQYSRKAKPGYVATGTILGVLGTISGLGLPATLAGFSLELIRQMVGRKDPGALATITSKLTRSTREAALLAQIRAHSS